MNHEYITAALRTESRTNPATGEEFSIDERRRHSRLGIITELAELLDIEKKSTFYGKEYDKDHVIEELGDLCWYLALGLALRSDIILPTYNRVWDQPCLSLLESALHHVTDETTNFELRIVYVYVHARSFADELGLNWDEILWKNQLKLEARYKGKGFTAEEAINRDTATEKEAMQ